MKKKVLFVLMLMTSPLIMAQDEGPSEFSIDWYTIDGGGGTSTGGSFSLTGTIGQHDASTEPAFGGSFALSGGFWGGAFDFLFKDGFEQ